MLSKKCLLVGIFTLLSVSLAIAAPPAVHPTTGEPLVIDCLRGTPDAIDGDLSDWNLGAMTPAVLDTQEQLFSGQDTWDNPGDSSGEFYLLWDDVNIYIAVVMKDEKLSMNKSGGDIWNADAVEVFFSTLNAVAGHAEHYQYGFNANNQRWNWCNIDGNGSTEPDYLQIASSVTADGYICEASIPYGQMPSLDFSVGNTIGFHPVFDDTDNGDRELQMTWTGREAHDQSLGFGHLVLSADSAAEPEPEGPKIIWVSYHGADDEPHADAAAVGFTQAPDIGYTDLLKANGYNVTRVITSGTPDVEVLNAADLVIISRTASSGHYSNDGATMWNSITSPMINLNGYTLRSSRMGYTTGTTMVDTTGDVRLTVTDPAHPIFAGIPLTDGTMDNLFAEGAVVLPTDGVTVSRGISINNDPADDDGTVLATIAEASADTGPVGGMVIAEWPAGATMENSSGSPTDVLGGPRLVFLTGSREPSGVTGGEAAALYDLFPDGEQMFLNAVKYMIPDPTLVGWWPLNEGAGDIAVDLSGNGNDGTISNLNGGLGLDGSVWVEDPERGTVISFNGTADGAFVRAGDIPQMTLTNDFTWAFWAKHNAENTADNDIILGNRMDENAVDFVPRQFIKFTPTKFEWHMNGNGDDNLDYDDIPADVWLHHAVVKTADQLTYYRNGIEASSGTFTQPLDFPQPLFFGGDNEGAEGENWSGLMSDVRIYDRALSENEVIGLAGKTPVDPGTDGLAAFYALENDVLDSSGNGNDGTIVGAPTFIDGPAGYGMAMEFHGLGAPGGGGDYIDCGNDASLDIAGPISIALWIKPGADDPEGQGTETAPMAKAMAGISPWNWQVRYGWGSPQPYMAFTFNSSPRAWVYVGRNLERDEWCHIACSHDGTTLKCYLNGEQTDSTPMGEIATGEAPVLIGSDGWGCDWIGGIDEVAIYNRDLSAGEVRYLAGFREMVEPGTDGLAAAYEFETDATDSSGNGYDGTLLGDAHVQGGLLILDGEDDAVAIPGIGDGLTEFTFSMMVYPTVDVVPLQFSGGINTDSWGGGVHLKLNYGTVNVGVEPFAGGDVVGSTIVQPNTWTHLALTVSPDEVAVYLNGEKEGSRIVETGLAVNVGAATIGAWNNGGTDVQREMTGMMDNVLIYDRALSEAEVRYLASVKTDPMNLLPNPSFEEDEPILDDPDWVSWCTWNPAEGAGSNVTIVDTESIDGTRSLQVEPIGAENWFFILVNISFAANLDKNYTAGFWAKAVAPRPLTVQMKASDNSVDAWGATDFELTTEWTEYTYTSEVLHTDVKLEFLCAGSEVPFWLDLVSVYEAD